MSLGLKRHGHDLWTGHKFGEFSEAERVVAFGSGSTDEQMQQTRVQFHGKRDEVPTLSVSNQVCEPRGSRCGTSRNAAALGFTMLVWQDAS